MALSEVYIGPIVAEDITRVYLGSTLIFERGTGIDLDLGVMTFTGFVPGVDYTLELNTGEFVVAGYSPELGFEINTNLGELTFTGYEVSLANPLTSGLLHYYNFEESSGNLLDQVGSNDGTLVGPTQSVTGKVGNAYDFDGANDYIDLASDIDLTGDFTFACWFEQDFAGDELFRSSTGIHVARMLNQTNWAFKINGTTDYTFTQASSITNNVWHLLVFTRSGSVGRCYVDNVESTTGGLTIPTDTWKINRIGRNSSATWNGAIDELGIWDRVLSSAERDELWNSGSGITYPFT